MSSKKKMPGRQFADQTRAHAGVISSMGLAFDSHSTSQFEIGSSTLELVRAQRREMGDDNIQ